MSMTAETAWKIKFSNQNRNSVGVMNLAVHYFDHIQQPVSLYDLILHIVPHIFA